MQEVYKNKLSSVFEITFNNTVEMLQKTTP